MTQRIALLRGINVGGNNKIPMAELRAMVAELGFENPRTLLQSGNLVFGSDSRTDLELEALLEEATEATFGARVEYRVRSVEELAAIIQANPYPVEAEKDPSHLLVAFYKSPLDPDACTRLRQAIQGREQFVEVGREAYFVFPDGIGDSKLTNSVMDSKLGQKGTARNWNTILKLFQMATTRPLKAPSEETLR